MADTYGKHAPRVLAHQKESELASWDNREKFGYRMLRALTGPESVKIRIFIEDGQGKKIATRDVKIPPIPPFDERFASALSILKTATKSRWKFEKNSF